MSTTTASRRIRVLVVEDSGFMRGMIRQILQADAQIEVIGFATDGLEATRAVAALAPDVVTMDLHMPHADGLAAVARIMAERPTPILMLSGATREGSAAAIRALELGAVDCIAKPAGNVDPGLDALGPTIIRKVKMAARVRPVRTVPISRPALPAPAGEAPRSARAAAQSCLVLAASTGGPAALLALVPALPADLPASVVVVQHIPAPYTAPLARELAARSALPVREAAEGDKLAPGRVYLAPGSRDLTVSRQGEIRLRPASRDTAVAPSANLAMASVARYAGALAIGVVLTGMGTDGAVGAEAIARAGGRVIAQDETSSVIYGMPRAAVETGCVDAVVPLARLPETLVACLQDPLAYRAWVGHAS
jgi:two-component system chemotaxis response regulator CheB